MTAATARAFTRATSKKPLHVHLPSVHIRSSEGNGFDYTEDYYAIDRRVERVVRLAILRGGSQTLERRTTDVLCAEEMQHLANSLPMLMDPDDPDAQALMEECARKEYARQLRIAAGREMVCAGCGCSETRSCSGGCLWATATLCSRCAL